MLGIDPETVLFGLVHHPFKRDAGELSLAISSAYVAMAPAKPHTVMALTVMALIRSRRIP